MLPKRYDNEKLGDHWLVDETPDSFYQFLNYLLLTTDIKCYFEQSLSNTKLYTKTKDLIVADLGAGTGWTSSIIALKPEVKKVYIIEPSTNRLKIAKNVLKHFGVDMNKITLINSTFSEFSIPETVDIFCMNGSFHHCYDKDMNGLFENIRNVLSPRTINKYYNTLKFRDEEIESVGKVLITGEHVLKPLIIELRKIRWLTKFEWLKNSESRRYKPGSWNAPDEFSGEHNRTKKEIDRIFLKERFDADYYFFDGHVHKKGHKWKFYDLIRLKYYYAILEPNF